jgi:hypothetical protein
MASIVTLIPQFNNYFSDVNIQMLQNELLSRAAIHVTKEDIKRILMRTIYSSSELTSPNKISDNSQSDIDMINNWVISTILHDYENHRIEENRNYKWGYAFPYNNVYNELAKMGPDLKGIKLSRQRSTLSYPMTYNTFDLRFK